MNVAIDHNDYLVPLILALLVHEELWLKDKPQYEVVQSEQHCEEHERVQKCYLVLEVGTL